MGRHMVKRNTAPSTIPLYIKGMNAKYVNKNKSMKDMVGTIKGEKTVDNISETVLRVFSSRISFSMFSICFVSSIMIYSLLKRDVGMLSS